MGMVKVKTGMHAVYFPDDVIVPPNTELEVPEHLAHELVSSNRATRLDSPEDQKAKAAVAAEADKAAQQAAADKAAVDAWNAKAAAASAAARKAADAERAKAAPAK